MYILIYFTIRILYLMDNYASGMQGKLQAQTENWLYFNTGVEEQNSGTSVFSISLQILSLLDTALLRSVLNILPCSRSECLFCNPSLCHPMSDQR